MLQKLKTQTQAYWQDEFAVSQKDLEFVYSLLIETGTPLTSSQVAHALIEQRLEEEINQIKVNLKRGQPFQPQGMYSLGEGLVFPALDAKYGTVIEQRSGYNPEYGDFTVIKVQIEGEDKPREFASNLTSPHKLNFGESVDNLLADVSGTGSDEIFRIYGAVIQDKLAKSLAEASGLDFVQFGDLWYLKGLLVDVHVGHRNIVEAVIDVNGTALSPEAILEQLDLPKEIATAAQLFSLNHALKRDERFDDVGTDETVLWFLKRLEPPEAQYPPRRLLASIESYDRSMLTEELLRLEKDLDDELSVVERSSGEFPDSPTMSFALTYAHHRVGTIPLTRRVQQFFPKGSTQHTRVTLIDGQTGEHMPAWVVHKHRYVYGLDQWYKENRILVGSYITLEKTDDFFKVIINFKPKREKREWIRVAKPDDQELRFEMQKHSCRCEYDELLVLGEDDRKKLDELWVRSEVDQVGLDSMLQNVIMELAKLNPQGTVHAKTIYSAANIIRRCPPGPIFATLIRNDRFMPVGDNYWLYSEEE